MARRTSHPSTRRPPESAHAVVVGASIAGLLAARVLADFYERVTIVERDVLPEVGHGRRSVPQGRHVHALLGSGRRAMEELLPGLGDDLLADGAVVARAMAEIQMVIGGHELTREAEGADVLLAGRPLIEGHVRRRVLALANVEARDGCRAMGLLTAGDGGRVCGVRVRSDDEPAEAQLDAGLVVAASGRASQVLGWLDRLGHRRPPEERLRIGVGYASRPLRLRPGALSEKIVLIGARPGLPRGLVLLAQEHGRWIVTASGYGDEHRPPTDEAAFLDFIGTVAPPAVTAAIREAEPLGDIATYGFPANQRRRYERLERFPEGLLVTGDAITSFNPLYGQGMSVAALEALALQRCLEAGDHRLAPRFFGAAAKVVDLAWELALGSDLALPEVEGPRPLAVRVSNAYVERLLSAAEHDPVVAAAFNDVADMLVPSQHVLRPRIAWRVLLGGRRRDVTAAGSGVGRTPSRPWGVAIGRIRRAMGDGGLEPPTSSLSGDHPRRMQEEPMKPDVP
jgi:2-polyprenyl-6-methoxyphenol hydroxylase-like FAD-dependent oxidoreductase